LSLSRIVIPTHVMMTVRHGSQTASMPRRLPPLEVERRRKIRYENLSETWGYSVFALAGTKTTTYSRDDLLPSGRDRLRIQPKQVMAFVIDENLEQIGVHIPVGSSVFRHDISYL
jgi:hypothetical protein